MNKFQKDILNLIKCALNNEEYICSDLNYRQIFEFAKKQQLVGVLFYSLSMIANFNNSDVFHDFLISFMSNLAISETQAFELDALFKEFNRNNINYVPLKGLVLRKLYPNPDMRTMGDADVLIRLEQFDEINEIMKKCGFVFDYESDHEISYNKNGKIHIELHKRLLPTSCIDFINYYGDGWEIIKENKMSDEDFFIYIFTHFSKHYRYGGAGIKFIIDFYIYKENKKNLNNIYIEEELAKLKLKDFYKNICDVLSVWFYNGVSNEKIDFITNVIFGCGTYGDINERALAEGAIKSKKMKYVRGRKLFEYLFPSFTSMCYYYPYLKKNKGLLPIMYIIRIIKKVFTKGKVGSAIKYINAMDEEKINQYQKDLNYVGLDFNFDNKD